MLLSPDQDRAVRSWQRGDICVVAGPGSGKTRVLVERLRWLIVDREVPPESILAITFTEKAAYEMRSRLVGEGQPSRAVREKFEAARVSTIDAFCHRLLKENALQAGIDPGFEVLDDAEARDLLRGAIVQTLDEAFAEGGASLRAFLAAYATTAPRSPKGDPLSLIDDLAQLARSVRSYGSEPFLQEPESPRAALAGALRELAAAKQLDRLADIACRTEEAADGDPGTLAAVLEEAERVMKAERIQKRGKIKSVVARVRDLLPACKAAAAAAANRAAREWLLRTLRRTLAAFAQAKAAAGRMDFDDILAGAADLLAAADGPTLAFQHVLVDEFQDTNPLQIRLVERLLAAHGSKPPVRFVVGDINQSIYGFRHSDQNVFREYRQGIEVGGGEVIRLSENFRSRQEVLDAVHRILPGGKASGVERHSLRSGNRFPDKAEPSVEVQILVDGGERTLEQEGLWLAQRLHELKRGLRPASRDGAEVRSRSLEWGDVAILVRTNDRAARIASALRAAGVPCQAGGGQRLFRAPETAELAAFLRILRNPRDEVSLAATLKSPLCGIDDATLLRLKRDRANLSEALTDDEPAALALGADAESRLRRFRGMLSDCRTDRATVPVRFLLARAIATCGYRSYLARREDAPQALANVDRLLEWIGRREMQGTASLDAVSEALDRAIEAGLPSKEVPDGAASRQAVQVLTMHGAKGLEFPVVALASLQSSARGPSQGLLFSPDHGIGARWRRPFEGGPEPDSSYRLTKLDLQRREREEADRLFYVAMTRAEEHLILSSSFRGVAKRLNWCKPVFARLGLHPNEEPGKDADDRSAGLARFRHAKAAAEPPRSEQGNGAAALGLPEVLLPLAPSAQADYVATVTDVTTFSQCPRRYFLSRYLALERGSQAIPSLEEPRERESAPRDGMDAAEFGTEVHRHLAGLLDDPPPEVRRVAACFFRHELGRRAAGAPRVQKEMSFVFAVGEHLLRGTVDLLFEEGGERILVDYKTDRTAPERLAAAARRYAAQLQLYAAGLAKAGKPVDRAAVFYLRPGTPVDIDVGAAALAGARSLVGRFFEAQARHDYPTRPGARCRRCPHYRADCPAEIP